MGNKRLPAFTTGVDVWGFFAAHLYSYPLLPIVLRELFQNARDACRRVGHQPRIRIAVLGDTDFRYGQVVCRDNGCGMDEDTILDNFLCLGGTDKTQGDTGGFGIAKAVILGGCTWWEVRTHPSAGSGQVPSAGSGQVPSTSSELALNAVKGRCLCVSLDHVRERRPVDVVASRQVGSRILLRYDPLPEHDPRYARLRFQSWHFAQALSWLAHSDTPCTVTGRAGDQRAQVWRLEGLRTGEESIVAEGGDGRTTWTLHQVPPLALSPFSFGQGEHQVSREISSAGRLFVRLAGLVQFDEYMGDHVDCWALDVETEAAPKDPDYPFSLSREKMARPLMEMVDAVLEAHRRNPVSSHRRQFRRADHPTTVYYQGEWLGIGQRPARHDVEQARLETARQVTGSGDVSLRVSVFAQAMNVAPNVQRSPLGFAIQIKGVDKTRRDCLAPHNLRLLAAWAQVVDLVMQANGIQERFGIGFAFDADTFAERVTDGQGVFYLINPNTTGVVTSRAEETLLKMFVHAGHEVAHSQYPDHGEYHSSYMGDLLTNAAGLFAARQRRLAQELRGRKSSPLMQGLQMSFEEMLVTGGNEHAA
ncbi:MAG: ATP-binding protein [Chloroflexota bacterium]|nr:ATP-binding protein [Chloroflexota bacterium]